jgi:hypothetical protein
MALAAGDAWLDKASNLLLFGPPGANHPFADWNKVFPDSTLS